MFYGAAGVWYFLWRLYDGEEGKRAEERTAVTKTERGREGQRQNKWSRRGINKEVSERTDEGYEEATEEGFEV